MTADLKAPSTRQPAKAISLTLGSGLIWRKIDVCGFLSEIMEAMTAGLESEGFWPCDECGRWFHKDRLNSYDTCLFCSDCSADKDD